MIEGWSLQPDSTPTRSTLWDSSWPELAEDDRSLIFPYLDERFGIPVSLFDEFVLFKNKSGWWLLKETVHLSSVASLKVVNTGLRSFRKIGAFIKPTTRFIQLFGSHARKSILNITEKQLVKLLSDNPLDVEKMKIENGYVIIKVNGNIVSLGLSISGRVRIQVSKRSISDVEIR